MISSVTSFVNKRRRGLTVLASVAGGVYLLTSYARQRFLDLTERSVTDRAAKENLRRRFHQNQDDCAFTLLALLPVLSKQILEELDVEALTAELQRRAEETKKGKTSTANSLANSGLADSTKTLDNSIVSVSGASALLYSTDGQSILANGSLGESYHLTEEAAKIPLPEDVNQAGEGEAEHNNGKLEAPFEDTPPTPVTPDPRTKAELWQATKILTFQRTVTSIYLLSLLILQTHVQLNLLGRHNYINSIYEQAWASATSSESNMALDADATLDDLVSSKLATEGEKGAVDAVTEQQYLTFSWWFLQRGWRQVDERVKEATEEVLESVSLKTVLSSQDLNKLLLEIRRKLEYKPTGAVYSFSGALFPQTAEQEEETIRESGISTSPDAKISRSLLNLLNETRDFVDSPDFSIVLRSCLDRAFQILASSIGHVFIDEQASAQSPFGMGSSRFEEVTEKKVRLAAILPALARSTHTILNGMPNEYAEALADNRELLEFSAVVYSNFAIE